VDDASWMGAAAGAAASAAAAAGASPVTPVREASTASEVAAPASRLSATPVPAAPAGCAAEGWVLFPALHADVASKTESRPAASRLFLSMRE